MTKPDPLINLDWLAFSVVMPPSSSEEEGIKLNSPDGFRIVEYTGTNIYKRRAILFAKSGEKICTLLLQPYSKVIRHDSVLVEIANKWLYLGWEWILDVLQLVHPFAILCVSRVDLCADFPPDADQLKIIEGLATNFYYVAGKGTGSQFFEFDHGVKVERIPHCISWGSKKSNIKWKLYNKSKEITEAEETKQYILDAWKDAGFEGTIWRLEVSITSASGYEYEGHKLSLSDFRLVGFAEMLYGSMYSNRFVTRQNQGHKDKSNDKRVYLLGDLGAFSRLTQRKPSSVREVLEYVSGLRRAMEQASKPEVILNPAMETIWRTTIKQCVEVGNLSNYFWKTYGYKIDKLDNELDKLRDSLLTSIIPSPHH